MAAHYAAADIAPALRSLDLGERPVFTHAGLAMHGLPSEGTEALNDIWWQAGSAELAQCAWIVPTFTYSFCKGEVFDIDTTPSTVGPFTEFVRNRPGVLRSADPIFSVAGAGPACDKLFAALPHECFGADCIYDRLLDEDCWLVNIGVGPRWATCIHHFEWRVGVPYRYRKAFDGTVRSEGESRSESWVYYVRALSNNSIPDLRRFESVANERGLVRRVAVGLGEITVISFRDYCDLAHQMIATDPWVLASGPAIDLPRPTDCVD